MPKIMIVDDEATITTHLEEELARMGYEPAGTAGSGEEAVRMAEKNRPDLILMDIVMPGKLDGIEAARKIKKDLDIPVVFLTAYGDDRYITRAKEAEPYGYIIKPFQENSLRASIEIALHSRETVLKLKESGEIWRELTENTLDGIIICDETGSIVFWNQGANRLFGYEFREAAGKPLTFLISEGTEGSLNQLMETLAEGGPEASHSGNLEAIGVRRDWSKFPVEMSLTSIPGRKGNMLVCLARDITENRKVQSRLQSSLQEQEIRIRNVRDRIRSDMDLISDMIHLQMNLAREKRSLNSVLDSRDKMEALARENEKTGAALAEIGVRFEFYTHSLIRRLYNVFKADPERIKPVIRMDPISLDLQTTIPCGLIISELVSNSLKYAFLESGSGWIKIDLSCGPEGRCRLVIMDNGSGLPDHIDIRTPSTLGMQIVAQLVDQIKGKMLLDRKEGTCFTIEFHPQGKNAS